MKFFISFIFILIIFSSSCSRLSKSSAENTRTVSLPPPVLPPEKSFLKELAVGDTVFIFYKLSGWSNTAHLRNFNHYSFYAMHQVWRISEKEYIKKETWGYTAPNRFKPFEFDTMMYRLSELKSLLSNFEFYCPDDSDSASDEEKEKCFWHDDFTNKPIIYLNDYLNDDLCDAKYNAWRFKRPSYEELENWRSSDYGEGLGKREMLVFWRDTCKISYAERGSPLVLVYDY